MYAAEIDARKALDRWLKSRRAALEQIALRGTWLDEEDVARLLRLSLPGIDEVAALLEIARFGADARFNSIVVDTAPTGHTLRMLSMPETLQRIAEVFERLHTKHRVMVEALTGAYVADSADALIAEIYRAGHDLASLLRDRGTTRVSWVSLPELMSVEETGAAAAALAKSHIPLAEVMVNRVTSPSSDRCRWCEGRVVLEQQAMRRLRKRMPRVSAIEVAARATEPRGVHALNAIGVEIDARRVIAASSRLKRMPGRIRPADQGLMHSRQVFALPASRLFLFGGKGGVGKTTCAAAMALSLASRTRGPILLLSTDPAHSLSDVLGQSVGAAPRRMRGAPANLQVREIDATRELSRIRARYARSVDALFDRLARGRTSSVQIDVSHDRNAMYGLIELAPPGIDELAAIIDVADSIGADPTRTIILDTAPTGHALRLLEMPELVHDWVKALMSIVLKYQPIGGVGELGPALVELSRGLGRLRGLIADRNNTSFIVVTRAAALPRAETIDLVAALKRLDIHVPAVVINAVGRGTCRRCKSEARIERRHITALHREIPRSATIVIAPAELPPPHGAKALRRWARSIRGFNDSGIRS